MVKKYAVAVVVFLALFLVASMSYAASEELKNFLKEHNTIKICIELKNSSEDDKVDIDRLKELLEKGFASRRSHKFIIVANPAESDIVLKGDVKEYMWTDTDPVDQVWGFGPAAMDAATSEHYARMQLQTEIVNAKNNRVLWSEKIQANMTKSIMPKDSSYELVYNRFVKTILIQIFKKRT